VLVRLDRFDAKAERTSVVRGKLKALGREKERARSGRRLSGER
jgi:hypothetical protein